MLQKNKADRLRIWLFGECIVKINSKALSFPTREAETLFVFLLLHRDRCFNRDILIQKFFPDLNLSDARKRLRNDVWRLRSVLEPEEEDAGSYLIVTKREIGFNTSSEYWLDIEDFEKTIQLFSCSNNNVLATEAQERLSKSLGLYRGDLLEGVCDEWCLWEKERLKMLFLRGLEKMINHHASMSQWHRAITLAEQFVSQDNLREHVHRSLMRFYYAAGDRPAALRQYALCADLLRQELDIEPMRETVELYEAIKDETLSYDKSQITDASVKPATNELVSQCLGDICLLADQLDDISVKLKRRLEIVQNLDNG